MKTKPITILSLMILGMATGHAQLDMFFTNDSSYADSNVWVTIQRNTSASNPVTEGYVPDVTLGVGGSNIIWQDTSTITTNYTVVTNIVDDMTNYVTTTNYATNTGSVYSDPVSLAQIKADGGLNWISNAPGVDIVISYGAPIPVSSYSTATIAPGSTADASYNIPYQYFELSYTPNPNDQGDVTAINYFTAPIGISAFTNNTATGSPIQKVGYSGYTGATSQNIYSQLASITSSNPAAVQFQTNSGGTTNLSAPLRVLGPTSYGTGTPGALNDNGPYTSFNNYFSNMASSSNQTILENVSSYNNAPTVASNQAYNNMGVTFNLTNMVSYTVSGYQLLATGNITAVFNYYNSDHMVTNTVTNNITGVTLTVSPVAGNLTNVASAFIYGGSSSEYPANIQMGGPGWTNFMNQASGYVSSGADSSNAASIVAAQISGELASAFAFGFAGSTNTVTQYGTNQLGTLPSEDWWALTNPIAAFNQVQTNNSFYDQYASVIFNNTSNSVYGYAYSDRFINSPSLINSYEVTTPDSTNQVESWLVDVGEPITVPEPSDLGLFLLGAGILTVGVVARGRKDRAKQKPIH